MGWKNDSISKGRALRVLGILSFDRSSTDFPTVPRAGATPVPIPNTEVKPCFGDGTAGFPLWESSATVGSLERRRVDLSVDAAPLSFVVARVADARGRLLRSTPCDLRDPGEVDSSPG